MLLQKEGEVLKHINFVSLLSATWKDSDKAKFSLVNCGKRNDPCCAFVYVLRNLTHRRGNCIAFYRILDWVD